MKGDWKKTILFRERQGTWILVAGLPLIVCVTLDKPLPSGPEFPQL